MSEKLDLFAFLSALSSHRRRPLQQLPEVTQKEVAPFVLMRWLTGTADKEQLLRLNERVNPYAFSLGGEKALLTDLLASSCTGRTARYTWIKGPGGKGDKLAVKVTAEYYNTSEREAAMYDIDAESLVAMAEDLGWSAADVKKLQEETGHGPRGTESKGRRSTKRG